MAIEPTRLLFDVDDYHALGRIGFFGNDRRLELIDGEILEMTPIGPEHANCVRRLNALFSSRLGGRAVIDAQGPVRLGNLSEPQPDLTLLEPPLHRYDHRHAMADDVLLVVEVSDTTLRFDRKVKAPLYARQRLGELWVIDLNAGVVEVHRQPSAEGYRTVERHGRGDVIVPQALPDLVVSVEEILG